MSLKAKKYYRSDRVEKLKKENRKEIKKSLFAQVDESLFWALQDYLHEHRLSYVQWLQNQIIKVTKSHV